MLVRLYECHDNLSYDGIPNPIHYETDQEPHTNQSSGVVRDALVSRGFAL